MQYKRKESPQALFFDRLLDMLTKIKCKPGRRNHHAGLIGSGVYGMMFALGIGEALGFHTISI